MIETLWKWVGVFIFVYSGLLNGLLLVLFLRKRLYVLNLPWSEVKKKT